MTADRDERLDALRQLCECVIEDPEGEDERERASAYGWAFDTLGEMAVGWFDKVVAGDVEALRGALSYPQNLDEMLVGIDDAVRRANRLAAGMPAHRGWPEPEFGRGVRHQCACGWRSRRFVGATAERDAQYAHDDHVLEATGAAPS